MEYRNTYTQSWVIIMTSKYDFEIKQFLLEIRDITKASENMTNNTGINFDPFLFMAWRASRK